MSATEQRLMEVWGDWAWLRGPKRIGTLCATPVRGKEIFFFEYDPLWIRSEHAQSLDPSLRLFAGPQYPSAGKMNFGVFLDSSPDRWGRLLMDRRESLVAREEGRAR